MAADPGTGDTCNRFDGVAVGPVVQGRDIRVELPATVPSGLLGLRAPRRTFVGRDRERDELVELLDPARDPRAVAVVSGLGGVGKTELVVQAAHAAVARGWFAGAVMLDLHGYDPLRRVETGQALEELLRALQVSGEHIPPQAQGRQRLLRTVLAEYARLGRPVLLVIDNVAPAAPAEPLLPGVGPVLVTSRHTLSELDGRMIELGVLSDDDAVRLLAERLAHRLGDGERRVVDHPDDAALVARACSGLPLAVEIVAALLAAHPAMPLAEMHRRLEDEHTRLAELVHRDRAVRAAFALSYDSLTDEQRRVFRLLTVNPGPDVSTETAAVAANSARDVVRSAVEALADAHLVEPAGAFGRWRMHDLVRLYATDLGRHHAHEDDRAGALVRVLEHYRARTRAAAAHLDPTDSDPASRGFTDRGTALAWLDVESPNLAAAARTAARPRPDIAIDVPLALAAYLNRRRRFAELIELTELARDTARRTGDRRGEGAAWGNLSDALRFSRRFEEAVTAQQHARIIFEEIGDRRSEGRAWSNLGNALQGMRRFGEAITAHEHARGIYQETGDRHSEGTAWSNLGIALRHLRRFQEAVTAHEHARSIFQETGDRHGEGKAWSNLGNALQEVRRFEEAVTAHEHARGIYQETDDRHSEGTAWSNLGNALQGVRRFEEAATAYENGLAVFREFDDRHGEAVALYGLGRMLRVLGRPGADDVLRNALALFEELGDERGADVVRRARE